MVGEHKVVTLCGSTRFRREFEEANKNLTLAGNIVISVGLFGHAGDGEVWEGMDEGTPTQTKLMLDAIHKRKIDMADEIYVINAGGYMGSSTRSEIAYARAHGKAVRYLEECSCVLDSLAPATTDDFDEVWRLYARVCEQSAHDEYSPLWTLGMYPSEEGIRTHIREGELHVGRVDGRIGAAMAFVPHDDEEYLDIAWPTPATRDEVATIHLLAVHPSLRGRHASAELVDEALRLAYAQGKCVIHLGVMQGNLVASRLYEAAGFRLVGTHRICYESTGPVDFKLYEYAT